MPKVNKSKTSDVSFFLYLHKDLSNEPGVWKLGKAITPYSAVRARQKFMWKTFGLSHLYFGRPSHITELEEILKKELFDFSAAKLINSTGRTELFKIPITNLLQVIEGVIKKEKFDVVKMEMHKLYTASKSSDCPYGIPSETNSYWHLSERVNNNFGSSFGENMTDLLFEEV